MEDKQIAILRGFAIDFIAGMLAIIGAFLFNITLSIQDNTLAIRERTAHERSYNDMAMEHQAELTEEEQGKAILEYALNGIGNHDDGILKCGICHERG